MFIFVFYFLKKKILIISSFHPTKPILATTSGQRKIEISEIICSDDTSSSETEKELFVRDNSLKIWDLSNKKKELN
jgi:hypothetical protein